MGGNENASVHQYPPDPETIDPRTDPSNGSSIFVPRFSRVCHGHCVLIESYQHER